MPVKRCQSWGCTKAPRCEHSWHVSVTQTVKGVKVRERGPMKAYAHLLEPHERLNPTSKAQAELLEARILDWVVKGKPMVVLTDKVVTIGDAIAKYKDRYLKDSKDKSMPSILKWLDQDLGSRPLTDLLDADLLAEYRDDIVEEGGSNATANRYLAYLSILYNYASGRPEWNLNGKSPFYHQTRNRTGVRKLPEHSRTRRVTPEDEAALVQAIEKLGAGSSQMLGRFYCALECGLRRGEMLKLRKEDVKRNFRDRHGVVHPVVLHLRSSNTKSGKERYVPVVGQKLQKFLNDRRLFDYPFGADDGKQIESFRNDWEKVVAAAKLPETEEDGGMRWHDLRHEFGSRAIEAGVEIHELKELMGHASITTTERYLSAKLGLAAQGLQRMVGNE